MPAGKVLSQDAVDMIRYMHEVHKLTYAKIGELIGRPKGYIGRVIESVDPETGIRKLGRKGRHIKTTTEHDQRIKQIALGNPYIGCEALTRLYNDESELKLSKSSVHRRLKDVGVEVIKVAAKDGDLQEKKTFPKSQTVWKFVEIVERRKRVVKRKRKSVTGAASTLAPSAPIISSLEQIVVTLPESGLSDPNETGPSETIHTINVLIDPSLGVPQIMQFGIGGLTHRLS